MKLLFEIGTEELPAGEIDTAVETLARHLIRACADARLSHGEVQTFATPRRLAVRIHDIAAVGEASEETALGPAVKAAFDAEGRPTKAAEGFARGKGIAVEELLRVVTPKGEYIGAVVREEGKPAAEVITAALHSVFAAFAWKRSMRWGWGTEQFARPIHTIIALLDGELLPVSFAGVEAGRETFGHSIIVDPWGRVLAEGGSEPGVVMAEIDPALVTEARARMPSLQHGRRFEMFEPMAEPTHLHLVPDPK